MFFFLPPIVHSPVYFSVAVVKGGGCRPRASRLNSSYFSWKRRSPGDVGTTVSSSSYLHRTDRFQPLSRPVRCFLPPRSLTTLGNNCTAIVFRVPHYRLFTILRSLTTEKAASESRIGLRSLQRTVSRKFTFLFFGVRRIIELICRRKFDENSFSKRRSGW